jgi:acyl homoserine lactone synthase
MIIAINGANNYAYSGLLDQMYQLRAEVFHDRLGWDVTVENGKERDQFDDANPMYLISVDGYGRIKGSLRLLPTTGLNMLRNVFQELLPEGKVVENPLIWESTRFCVSRSAAAEITGKRLNRTTGELLAGLVEISIMAGLISVVSVFNGIMKRILSLAGYPAEIIGEPKRIGKCMTYAGLLPVDKLALRRIQEASGIEGSVLEVENMQLVFAA